MADKIRWGVLSTARIGRRQVIPAIQQSRNGEVVAIASRDLDRARAAAQELKIPRTYGSYRELIADPNVDAIYNPLPNNQHPEWSIRAAEAGKAVLCEKPLAINADEARKMAGAFEKCGVLLVEGFMYRFHPQTQKVKQLVDAGAIGKVQIIHASLDVTIESEADFRLVKEMGGGAMFDVGCYCINLMRFITGEEPADVSAFARFNPKSPVDEIIAGALTFPSGVLGHFDGSLRTYMTQNYEIVGTNGRIRAEKGFVPFIPDPKADAIIRYWRGGDPVNGEHYEEFKFAPVNQYTLMVEDFADALLTHRPPRYPVQDAIRNMEAIDRLLASAERNRRHT